MLGGVNTAEASLVAGGLAGLCEVGWGSTPEQRSVLAAIAVSAWGLPTPIDPIDPAVLRSVERTPLRRRILQLAIVLELCRHPRCDDQRSEIEDLADAFGVGAEEVEAVRALATTSADEATGDFIRRYGEYRTDLSEVSLLAANPTEQTSLFAALDGFVDLPEDSLGQAYLAFHERNGFRVPGPTTPVPAYYVSHDMNHVIAGYEPTGPGEIALGAFKLAMGDTEANWMALMANLMIHEAGLIKHGTEEQFTPWGGDIYRDEAGEGALHLPGAAALLGEAWARGAATTTDFSQIDHLALAPLPLAEVRRRFGVLPRADGYDGGTGGPWSA